jgi:hypothetical protein
MRCYCVLRIAKGTVSGLPSISEPPLRVDPLTQYAVRITPASASEPGVRANLRSPNYSALRETG